MKISDFDFEIPKELIASRPAEKRDEASLVILGEKGEFVKGKVRDLPLYVNKGDLLIFNDTRVIKAKFTLPVGAGKAELYLNREENPNIWSAFGKPAKKFKEGDNFFFGENKITISDKGENGLLYVKFDLKGISLPDFAELYGEIPLPPYLKRKAEKSDEERYQTIYSLNPGSVAAPTAGLHFTEDLIDSLKEAGAEIAFVTLDVGAGTFLPVKTESLEDHKMHYEKAYISKETAEAINKAKREGRRVIAIGTTSLRALESSAKDGAVEPGSFETNLFIKPGFEFQIIDSLFTNFHLPKSTLLVLVSAFIGYSETKKLYGYALKEKLRFFSYGDAVLLNRPK